MRRVNAPERNSLMQYDAQWVEETLSSLTLQEKVGQVLITAQFDWSEETVARMEQELARWQPAGLFHMRGVPAEYIRGVPRLAAATRIPLLLASDFEAGIGHILHCGTRFPRPMARGYSGAAEDEYEIGRITAAEGRASGTLMTASPVLDLNTNPLNPDVNVRAYGEDLDTVLRLALPHIRGLQEHGMLAMVKHFPGNGDTAMDQHFAPAVIGTPAESFRRNWLEAYRRAFAEADPGAVMVSYLTVPSIMRERDPRTGSLLPACLSREVLQGLLRDELGFQGLAVSDALNMGGGLSFYPRGEIAAKALAAGIDLLLCFSGAGNLEPEVSAIRRALKKKELTEARLNEAVRRVLTAKAKVGLDRMRTTLVTDEEALRAELTPKSALCRRVLAQSLTLLSNTAGTLPIRKLAGKRVLVINTYSPTKQWFFDRGEPMPQDLIEQGLRARGAIVESLELGDASPADIHLVAIEKAAAVDYTFFNFFVVPSYAIGTLTPHKEAVRTFFCGLVTIGQTPPIITAFGDPYQRQYCHPAPTFLCTFDDTREALEMAVEAWCGDIPVHGRMPVSMPGVFQRGDGVDLVP
jgi:beta-N-acetylhexosaminidase